MRGVFVCGRVGVPSVIQFIFVSSKNKPMILKQIHMMKRYASLAILMAAMFFAVSCHKENQDKGPGTLPKEKVSRIYRTSHTLIEAYNSITETWRTTSDLTSEREIYFEFFWEGDRFTRAYLRGKNYSISYDDVGRIILATSENDEIRYEFSYHDGLLSYSLTHAYGIDEHVYYTWANGHLQKYETERISETGETTRESSEYTWNGNVLSSTVRTHQSVDGTTRSLRYDYEYTSIPNPFQNFVYCSAGYTGLIWDLDGADGLVNNMYSRINTDQSVYSFEYTTSGDRLQTITISQVSESGNSILTVRVTTDSYYEIEYLD